MTENDVLMLGILGAVVAVYVAIEAREWWRARALRETHRLAAVEARRRAMAPALPRYADSFVPHPHPLRDVVVRVHAVDEDAAWAVVAGGLV